MRRRDDGLLSDSILLDESHRRNDGSEGSWPRDSLEYVDMLELRSSEPENADSSGLEYNHRWQ